MIDPEAPFNSSLLYARNRWAVASIHDRDHGGPRGGGEGAPWARRVLAAHGLRQQVSLRLLTQPRWFGYVFNPVSFWLAFTEEKLVAVIAEVNNTYGDRHSYLCHKPGFSPIAPEDRLVSDKVFHVSPFQDVVGQYTFSFDIGAGAIAIRIAHRDGTEALIATLDGARRPLTAPGLLRAAMRFPFAGLRALALIHWQAVQLLRTGARFRARPLPPVEDIST